MLHAQHRALQISSHTAAAAVAHKFIRKLAHGNKHDNPSTIPLSTTISSTSQASTQNIPRTCSLNGDFLDPEYMPSSNSPTSLPTSSYTREGTGWQNEFWREVWKGNVMWHLLSTLPRLQILVPEWTPLAVRGLRAPLAVRGLHPEKFNAQDLARGCVEDALRML